MAHVLLLAILAPLWRDEVWCEEFRGHHVPAPAFRLAAQEGKGGERSQELEVEKGNNNRCCGPGEGERGSEQRGGGCPGTAAGSWLGKLLGSGKGWVWPGWGEGLEPNSQRGEGNSCWGWGEAREGAEGGGGAAKEKASRLRARAEGRVPGRRGTHRSAGGRGSAGQSQAAAAAGAEAPGAKTESWEHGQTTAGGGRDGKAANTGFGGWRRAQLLSWGQTGRKAEEESKAIAKGKGARAHPKGREKALRHKDLRIYPC